MIRMYIKNEHNTTSVLVTNPKYNSYGKWQTAKYYLTEAGSIEKSKVERWEKVQDWGKGTGANGVSQV